MLMLAQIISTLSAGAHIRIRYDDTTSTCENENQVKN